MANDIEHAAALQALGFLLTLETDLDRNRERRARDVADEVDVDRRIGDRIELNVTGQNPSDVAIDLEVVEAGEEATLSELAFQHVVVERNGERLAAAAVDDGGRAAFAPERPRPPLPRGSRGSASIVASSLMIMLPQYPCLAPQSKRLETEVSELMRRIDSAINCAMERTRIFAALSTASVI